MSIAEIDSMFDRLNEQPSAGTAIAYMAAKIKGYYAQKIASSPQKITSAPAASKGKPMAAGTLAWTAFVAHVQKTIPERFAPPALPKERLSIAGAIRLENPEAYKAFCEKFLREMAEQAEKEAEEKRFKEAFYEKFYREMPEGDFDDYERYEAFVEKFLREMPEGYYDYYDGQEMYNEYENMLYAEYEERVRNEAEMAGKVAKAEVDACC